MIFNSTKSVLILSYNLRQSLQSGFPSDFPIKTVYLSAASQFLHSRHALSLYCNHTKIWRKEKPVRLLIMQTFPLSCCCFLRCSLQSLPSLSYYEHLNSMSRTWCARPNFKCWRTHNCRTVETIQLCAQMRRNKLPICLLMNWNFSRLWWRI
jgi:hypothetical protein